MLCDLIRLRFIQRDIAARKSDEGQLVLGQDTVTPIMGAEEAREQAKTRDFLSNSQRKAIEEVLNSGIRILGLQGLAGTGKTTTLEVIREGAVKGGYTVEGFAPTSKAAGQLREAGSTRPRSRASLRVA
jgi:ATP-dependent exoDNAse (exonuclease V) alpha subunit